MSGLDPNLFATDEADLAAAGAIPCLIVPPESDHPHAMRCRGLCLPRAHAQVLAAIPHILEARDGPEGAEVRDDRDYFEGFHPRRCGEHRTVGTYRAWCYDCAEWCYPSDPCRSCKHE